MMELGATVCTPRAPRCDACPVSRWCRAHALGIALRLPSPRRKPKPVRLALSAAVLLDPRGRTLLVRQKSGHSALFSNLWHFPAVQSPAVQSPAVQSAAVQWAAVQSPAPQSLAPQSLHRSERPAPEKLAAYLRKEFGITAALEPLPPARHTVTFRRILLAPYLVRVPKLPRTNSRRPAPCAPRASPTSATCPSPAPQRRSPPPPELGHKKFGPKAARARLLFRAGPRSAGEPGC